MNKFSVSPVALKNTHIQIMNKPQVSGVYTTVKQHMIISTAI